MINSFVYGHINPRNVPPLEEFCPNFLSRSFIAQLLRVLPMTDHCNLRASATVSKLLSSALSAWSSLESMDWPWLEPTASCWDVMVPGGGIGVEGDVTVLATNRCCRRLDLATAVVLEEIWDMHE